MEKSLTDYVLAIRRMLWLIVGFVAVSCLTTFYVSKTLHTPTYSASAQLIVNTTNKGQDGLTYSDVNMNLNLMESYKEIMKSDKIIEAVAAAYPQLGIDRKQLKASLKVTAPDKTQLLNVSMEDANYSRAAQLVNAVTAQFMNEIPLLMSLNNITVLKQADPNATPAEVSPGTGMSLVVSFMVSLMCALGVVFFRENINHTVRTEKDVAYYSGLPLLATIGTISKNDSGFRSDPIPRKAGEAYVTVK